MKKTHNINLGGYPFTIDEDAYSQMDRYLSTIRRHFSKSEGCDEIMSDIETRMAELFNDELNNQPIISQSHLDSVVAIMGKPEEFGATSMYDDAPRSRATHDHEEDYHLGKKLFRDPENKKVGGVCSGLAAYFGIETLIMRISVFVIIFFTGIGIIPYFLLWAFVPEARTASDRLAMQGKPINIDSIGRIIEEEIDNFSDTVNEFKDEFRSKKK